MGQNEREASNLTYLVLKESPIFYTSKFYSRLPPPPPRSASSWSFGLTTCLASLRTATRSAALAALDGVKNVYAVPVLLVRPVLPIRWT